MSFGTRHRAAGGAVTVVTSLRVLFSRSGSTREDEAVTVIVTAPAVDITIRNWIEEAAPWVSGDALWVA
jgi:hypothetical protein